MLKRIVFTEERNRLETREEQVITVTSVTRHLSSKFSSLINYELKIFTDTFFKPHNRVHLSKLFLEFPAERS